MKVKVYKYLLLYGFSLFFLIIYSFEFHHKNKLTHTKWNLNCIKINQDTVFYKSDSLFTYRFNYQLNKTKVLNWRDSIQVNEISSNKYNSTKRLNIFFISDSTFVITKMRSGGRIFANELDSGNYKLLFNKVVMKIVTRNNYKLKFSIDKSCKKLFCIESYLKEQKVYSEYTLEN